MNLFVEVGFGLLLLVVIVPQHECNPFFFFPPRIPRPVAGTSNQSTTSAASSAQQQSNVSVALGNRINTVTGLDGVTVNVVRRRRRRDIWDIASSISSSIPAIPVPGGSLNGSYIAVGNQVFQLPDQLSNVSLNIVGSSSPSSSSPLLQSLNLSTAFIPSIPENYTNAFRSLVTQFQTLPLDTLDGLVQYLSVGYDSTFGQLFLESGFARLNQTLEYGRTVVQRGLNSLADQGAQGFAQLVQSFNGSTSRVQRCVGSQLNPNNVARAVVGRANECINAKWLELSELVGNIGEDIVAADNGASQFLGNLTACNGANFVASAETIELRNSLRRQCYVQAVGSFPQALLFLPISLTIDAAQLYASVQALQSDVVVCGSKLGLEIGMIGAQIGGKLLLCQISP